MGYTPAPILPTIILDVNVTTVTTFRLKNVVTNYYIYNTRRYADICVQFGTRPFEIAQFHSLERCKDAI
jgi:hypothetical protein